MLDFIAQQISPYTFIAIVFTGLTIGFFALPWVLRNPLFGAWLVGIGFSVFRYISSPSDRSLVSMILWTTMWLCIYIGRYAVRKVFDAPEMAVGFLPGQEVLEDPKIRAALLALEEAYREIEGEE